MSLNSEAYARAVIEEKDVAAVINALGRLPDHVLAGKDATTGASLIFFAVQRKNDEEALRVLKYLVEERAVCTPDLVDYNQQSAIFFAARDGNEHCVEYLVDKGCDPTYKDSAGQTCLFYACRDGRDAVVALLLKPPINLEINMPDKVGQTALFYAAREGRRSTVELLLKFGADASLRDWQKKCAHTYAQRKGHLELAAHLKGACAVNQEHLIAAKGKKKGGAPEIRHKCRLQHCVDLPSGEIWLFTHQEKSEEFEQQFPNIAAWSHMTQNTYTSADAFRMEWAREALEIVHIVSNYKGGWLFSKPVDTKAWNCPDYYNIISEPRDFQYIRRKLKTLDYYSVRTFIRDMDLVFTNCFRYNSDASQVHKAGKKVQAFYQSVFDERDLSKWIRKEDEVIAYLQAENLPVTIGEAQETPTSKTDNKPASGEHPIGGEEDPLVLLPDHNDFDGPSQ